MQPNILWISTHDINPHLGCYAGVWPGAEYAVTPHLDRLATEGIRYNNAFATAPVCAPSRSSVYTGCFPTAIGTMHHRTKAVPPPEVRLLPEYFRAAGYYTANNFLLDAQVAAPPTTFDDCSPTAHWRNRPSADTPFFAAFHGVITHESQIYYDDDQFAQATRNVRDTERHDPDKAPLPPYHPDTPTFRKSWARYSDLITEMDHSVGELLRQLDEDGLTESTIVVFWSDHGLGMPRGKRWVNESGLREPLLIRWPAAIAPATVRDDLVSLMDLAPTMLEMCGLPVPEHMHGTPVILRDGTPVDEPNQYVIGARDRMDEQEDTSRTIRDPRYRLIRHLHPDRSPMQHCDYPDHFTTWQELRSLAFAESEQVGRGEPRTLLTPLQRNLVAATKPEYELYDVIADPHEQTNLADDPRHAETLRRLAGVLDTWLTQVGDLGSANEHDLIEQWRPGGRKQTTLTPTYHHENGVLEIACATEGASLGWTTDPTPAEDGDKPYGPYLALLGMEADNRKWHLYTGPFTPPPNTTLRLRAWRIGFDPSQEVTLETAR